MATELNYLKTIPHGLGIHIPQAAERVAARTHIWRCLQRPSYWTTESLAFRGKEGFVPTLPVPVWNGDALEAVKAHWPHEFWLVGNHSDKEVHPTDAADFLVQWQAQTDTLVAFPGIGIDVDAFNWLDGYRAVGGPVPDAWHLHITGGPAEWKKKYNAFHQWMRINLVLRPVVVTGAEAGTLQMEPQKELLRSFVSELCTRHYLSAIFWLTAYEPARWGVSPITYSIALSGLGRAWIKVQREWGDACSSNSARPAWHLLGEGDRVDNGRSSRRRSNGRRDTGPVA